MYRLSIEKVYLFLFFTLLAWAAFAYITMIDLIDNQKKYSKLINISGIQRMYSQKIALLLQLEIQKPNPGLIQRVHKSLSTLKNNHQFLIQNIPSAAIKKFYFDAPYKIDQTIKQYLTSVLSFLDTKEPLILDQIQKHAFMILPKLDAVVNALEKESEEKSFILKETEKVILIGVIITLLIEALFLVFPVIRALRKKEQILLETNNNLESKVKHEVATRLQTEKLLIQQSKMAQMGNILGAIIHQWKQPLSGVSAIIENLRFSMQFQNLDEEKLTDSIENIAYLVQFMNSTSKDFRDFFSPNKERAHFSIAEAIEKVQNILSYRFKNETVGFVNDVQKDLLLYGYENEFMQVLLNLINNAMDAHLDNDTKDKKIILNALTEDETITVQVKDNAQGIPQELLPDKLFEDYISTKGDKGTGIGLAICKKIIEEDFQGTIAAFNEEQGAVVEIRLEKASAANADKR